MRTQGEQKRTLSNNETFSARIDAELAALLRQKAKTEDRTVSATLNRILREALQPEPQKTKGEKRERL
jgi:hypothetical protein